MNACDLRLNSLHTKIILHHLTIIMPAFYRSTYLEVPP